MLGRGLLSAGEPGQEWARKLAGSQGNSFGTAIYYAAAGEVDAMFEALEAACRQRDAFFIIMRPRMPFFDPYRADPRFHALLAKMNLV